MKPDFNERGHNVRRAGATHTGRELFMLRTKGKITWTHSASAQFLKANNKEEMSFFRFDMKCGTTSSSINKTRESITTTTRKSLVTSAGSSFSLHWGNTSVYLGGTSQEASTIQQVPFFFPPIQESIETYEEKACNGPNFPERSRVFVRIMTVMIVIRSFISLPAILLL